VVVVVLFVGDDWAEAHHDVEVMDAGGRRLARARLPEGVAGVARLHALIAEQLDEGRFGRDDGDAQVVVGIETGRGPWVQALLAAGYAVFAVNPLSVARFRERHGVSGAKSDAADAHLLADMVRTDSHQLRAVAADSDLVEAVKVVARAHKSLIWEQTRHVLRLRRGLLDYFPAAVEAFGDLGGGGLAAPDALELLQVAPDPGAAARLPKPRIRAALKHAHRRDIEAKTLKLQAVLRAPQLTQPDIVAQAYAATTRATVAVLVTLTQQIAALQSEVEACFGRHPDAEIVMSQPGLGPILGARVLAEFGDDPDRYRDAKARKNYAGTSPITRASGKRHVVSARYIHNDRLIDALGAQAFSALSTSPGARAYYDQLRARGIDHRPALRQLANRLVGILHGCLKTHTPYNETTAWPQHHQTPTTTAA
jgi:transposase